MSYSTNPAAVAKRRERERNRGGLSLNQVYFSKSARAIAMATIDRQYALNQLAADRPAKCCGRCKTPYNCGNKSCPCHNH